MDGYCVNRTNLPADVAFDTFFLINNMNFVWFERDGFRGTTLCTFGASDTFIGYVIFNDGYTFSCRTMSLDMRFVLIPEVTEGR